MLCRKFARIRYPGVVWVWYTNYRMQYPCVCRHTYIILYALVGICTSGVFQQFKRLWGRKTDGLLMRNEKNKKSKQNAHTTQNIYTEKIYSPVVRKYAQTTCIHRQRFKWLNTHCTIYSTYINRILSFFLKKVRISKKYEKKSTAHMYQAYRQ